MDILRAGIIELGEILTAAIMAAYHTPIATWAVILATGLGAISLTRIVRSVVRWIVASRGTPHSLTVKEGDANLDQAIYLNSGSVEALGLKGYDSVVLSASKGNRPGSSQVVEIYRRKATTLANNSVEIGPSLFRKLLPGEALVDGTSYNFFVRPFGDRGVEAYWFDPNLRVRFQNRFTVLLAVGIMVFQFILDRILK